MEILYCERFTHTWITIFFLDQLITVQGKQGEVKKQKEYNCCISYR